MFYINIIILIRKNFIINKTKNKFFTKIFSNKILEISNILEN